LWRHPWLASHLLRAPRRCHLGDALHESGIGRAALLLRWSLRALAGLREMGEQRHDRLGQDTDVLLEGGKISVGGVVFFSGHRSPILHRTAQYREF
jgi:hypothetical protein